MRAARFPHAQHLQLATRSQNPQPAFSPQQSASHALLQPEAHSHPTRSAARKPLAIHVLPRPVTRSQPATCDPPIPAAAAPLLARNPHATRNPRALRSRTPSAPPARGLRAIARLRLRRSRRLRRRRTRRQSRRRSRNPRSQPTEPPPQRKASSPAWTRTSLPPTAAPRQ